jgi:hypothetical protein
MSLWYIWRKPCTYLLPILTPSPNEKKWDLNWPTSPRSSIRCIQNDFIRDYGTFGANHSPIVRHYHQTNQNKLSLEPRHLGVPSGASKTIPRPMVCLAQTMHLSCIDTNTISKWTKMRFGLTTSPRSSIGCIQNDFWDSSMFGANCAPILRQD